MTYFPLLRTPSLSGSTTVYNFAPGGISSLVPSTKQLNLCWSDGMHWKNQHIASLKPGNKYTLEEEDIIFVPRDRLSLLYFSEDIMPSVHQSLPIALPLKNTPAWRATISLRSKSSRARSSYQGELTPFKEKGSFLTFNYFKQPSLHSINYLVLLNLVNNPAIREFTLSFHCTESNSLIKRVTAHSNSLTTISLDFLKDYSSRVVIGCTEMSFVPLFLSHNRAFSRISIEHSHPPASSVILGQRFKAQNLMKDKWLRLIK